MLAFRRLRYSQRVLEMLRQLASDSYLLTRACGPTVTARWLQAIAWNLPACLRAHSLSPADEAVGEGPFRARRGGVRAGLTGSCVMGGIREIWVRDVYLGGGFLEINDGDVVVDLGCNVGNFTTLALAHSPNVRVVSVDANPMFRDAIAKNLALNGWSGRLEFVNAFIGGSTNAQVKMRSEPDIAGVPTISASEFVEHYKLDRIQFLKCDIEGSEFELFGSDSLLLERTDQIAMEVHHMSGDGNGLMAHIASLGFETKVSRTSGTESIFLARRSRFAQKRGMA